MKNLITAATALVLFSTAMAQAAVDTRALIDGLQADGYTVIEVKGGVNFVKIEAIKDDQKLENIYSKATGEIVKSEVEPIGADDDDFLDDRRMDRRMDRREDRREDRRDDRDDRDDEDDGDDGDDGDDRDGRDGRNDDGSDSSDD